jgi:hypothetical protein
MASSMISSFVKAGQQAAGGQISFFRSRNEAKRLKKLADLQAGEARLSGSKLRSAQRVAFAKGGVSLQEGTPLEVMAETAERVELDALRKRVKTRRLAQNLRAEGALALLSAGGSSFSTILSGVQKGRAAGGGTKLGNVSAQSPGPR